MFCFVSEDELSGVDLEYDDPDEDMDPQEDSFFQEDNDEDKDNNVDGENVKQYQWKTGAKAVLQSIGFYYVLKSFWNDPIFLGFTKYYDNRGKKDTIKQNNLNNMKRLLFQMSNGAAKYSDKYITAGNFSRVVLKMEKHKVTYQTQANYYKSLAHFIAFERHRNLQKMTETGKDAAKRLKYQAMEIKSIGHRLHSRATNEDKDRKLLKKRGPTPWEVTALLRSKARNDVDTLLKVAEQGVQLTRNQVCKVNRFLVSYILLGLGNRLSAAEGITKELVDQGFEENMLKDYLGKEAVCINSRDHKTSQRYTARIVLNEWGLDFFKRYAQYVRPAIVKTSGTISAAFV